MVIWRGGAVGKQENEREVMVSRPEPPEPLSCLLAVDTGLGPSRARPATLTPSIADAPALTPLAVHAGTAGRASIRGSVARKRARHTTLLGRVPDARR